MYTNSTKVENTIRKSLENEMLQKYYKNITFILNLVIYIDFFIKKDKILTELWLYCRNFEEEKNTSIIYYILQNIIMVQKNEGE